METYNFYHCHSQFISFQRNRGLKRPPKALTLKVSWGAEEKVGDRNVFPYKRVMAVAATRGSETFRDNRYDCVSRQP